MTEESEESGADLKEWEMVSFKKTLSYSFGFILVFFMGRQFNTYVFYYYNVEVGLPLVLLGLAFVIFAIWNAINDPLVGYLTDRPFKWTRKLGMRFPWILIGAIPFLICYYLLFAIPDSLVEGSDPFPVFLYFVIVSCALDAFYSLFTTHINSGYTTQFRTTPERRRAQVINNTIPNVFALVIGFVVPIFYVYGDRQSMIFAQTIVVLLLFVALLITIPGIRESEELKDRFLKGYEKTGKDPYWPMMRAAFRNKSFVATLCVFMLLTFGAMLNQTSSIYFMKDILGLPFSFAIFTGLASFFGFILSIPFWSNMSKKYGHAKIMKLSCILIFLVYLPTLWMTTLTEAVIYAFAGGIVGGAFWVTLGPVNSDVMDELTIGTGKHQEATYQGFMTFFNRLAFAFVGIMIPLIQIITGYNTSPTATQTPLAIWGLRIQMGLIPSLFGLAAFIIMKKMYDLEGKKQTELIGKLREMGL